MVLVGWQVMELRIDDKDEIYCAKEQFRIMSLRSDQSGDFVIPDQTYRDVEPPRQTWTCTVCPLPSTCVV